LGLLQSDLLKEFKFAVRNGVTKTSYEKFNENPTATLTKEVTDLIEEDLKKYHDRRYLTLKNFVIAQHNGLSECDNNELQKLKAQIDDESPKRKAYYSYVLGRICDVHENPPEVVAYLPQPSQGFGDTFKQQASSSTSAAAPQNQFGSPTEVPQLSVLPGDNDQHTGITPQREMGGFKSFPKKTTGEPRKGGKSSRRHRRVRTLHKRRKSSKVRKTRYRRTHSRSRR
jgi:hypothetical protein